MLNGFVNGLVKSVHCGDVKPFFNSSSHLKNVLFLERFSLVNLRRTVVAGDSYSSELFAVDPNLISLRSARRAALTRCQGCHTALPADGCPLVTS